MTAERPPERGSVGRRLAITPRQVVALAVLVLALLFVLQNREDVSVNLLSLDLTSPLWLVLVLMLAIGALTGFVLGRRRV